MKASLLGLLTVALLAVLTYADRLLLMSAYPLGTFLPL